MKNKGLTVILILLAGLCLILSAALFYAEYRLALHQQAAIELINPRRAPTAVVSALTNRLNWGLITHKGVLGGTPGFYNPASIYMAGPGRVIAQWEDGHIRGYMVLGFTNRNGVYDLKALDGYAER